MLYFISTEQSCIFENETIVPGDTVQQDCNNCTCIDGVLECTNDTCGKFGFNIKHHTWLLLYL